MKEPIDIEISKDDLLNFNGILQELSDIDNEYFFEIAYNMRELKMDVITQGEFELTMAHKLGGELVGNSLQFPIKNDAIKFLDFKNDMAKMEPFKYKLMQIPLSAFPKDFKASRLVNFINLIINDKIDKPKKEEIPAPAIVAKDVDDNEST